VTRLRERIGEAAAFLRGKGVGAPVAAVVTGSGLSDVLALEDRVSVPAAEVPGFPRGAVKGHAQSVEFGTAEGVPLLVLRGRAHYYEGVDLAEATFPVRVVRELGARWIALTNAAGGIRSSYRVGDVVRITDHLNLIGTNPLIGPNDDELGPRFPDLSSAYDPALGRRADEAATEASVPLRHGVYAAVAGPHYETSAELRMLRTMGADLVGMSTVPETIVAVHAGLKVLGLSVVTDLALPEEPEPLAHDAVVTAAAEAAPRVDAILRGVLRRER
jgi:purine-nucleoside phosphorylase